MHSNHINYLAFPKRDIAKEVADEYYPFKPKQFAAQGKTEVLARRKYAAIQTER
jgi:hypothetical protein